ncbi:MAG: diguanylate cyclase [Xanthobacteraceae bacterium]
MEPIRWRPILGPAITLAVAAATLLIDRLVFHVPNPGAISFLAVAFAAYLGGIASGFAAAAISLAFAAFHLSPPGELLQFTPDDLKRLLVLGVCIPAIAVLTGVLHARAQRVLDRERDLNTELKALRAALDQSEVGVVLLDSELHVQFMNRAYRRLWRLPNELAECKPAFVDLLYHARSLKAYAVPADQMDAYVARRTAIVQAGDESPVDIRLASGDVIRCRCKVLTDGGRMLTYGNVSDLVRNADELADLALKDALTGIHNRRHFVHQLDGEWNRYRRYRRPLSLLVLDIDHFKSINDRYGHDVGDQVIVHVARLCREQTRDSDVVARIGGEEFAVLLPETDLADAHIAGERLREAVTRRPVPSSEGDIAVTVSIGTVQVDPTMADPAALVKRADEALYAAKRSGRNRVVAARGGASALPAQPAA